LRNNPVFRGLNRNVVQMIDQYQVVNLPFTQKLETRMSIRPLQDRVVVRRTEEETKSAGGIVIPDSATEKPSQGEVIAVGPGKKLDNGTVQEVDLSVGDKVLFGQYAGSTVKLDGEELLIMSESEIFGVVD
jgi:chaperonin GroES